MANIALIVNNILSDSGAEIGAANGVATLDSGGKIPVTQLPNSVMEFKGTWSAATNTPTLANGTGNAGDVYEVSAAGTVNFGAGGIAFALGDYVVYDGTSWQYSSGQKGTVTSLTFSAPLSGGTITTSGTISIPAATSSVDGYLKATDWVIFNGKQNALTNPVTGTGTTNYLPKFTGASTIGDSKIFDNGTNVLINSTTVLDTAVKLQVTSNSSGVTSFSSLADDVIFEHNTNLGLTFATPNTAIATIAFADPESNAAGVIQYSHVDNSMAFAVASAERMRLDSSGNLGIGTTSPTAKLTISGTGTGAAIDWTNTTATTGRSYRWVSLNAGGFAIEDLTASGAERLRVSTAGNLLVGTTTDAGYKLDVSGTLRAVSGASPSVFNTATGQGIAIENSGSSNKRYRLNVDGTSFLITEAGVGNPLTIAAGGAATFASSVRAGGDITYYNGTNLNAIITSGAADKGRMYLYSSGSADIGFQSGGNSWFLTNLGIGTSTPAASAKLTVMGNQTFGLPGNGANTSGRYLSIEGNTDVDGEGSGRIFFTEHNATTAAMDSYGMSLGYRGGGTSIVGASGNTWTGLSLIGNGEWGMFGHNGDNTGALIMYGDRAATFINLANNNLNNVNNAYFNGSVGIGTSSPATILDLSSTAPEITLTRNNNATTAAGMINWRTSNSTLRWNIGTNSLVGAGFEINYGSSNLLYIPSSGNVLINTTTDSGFKLDVSGTGRFTGALYANSVRSDAGITNTANAFEQVLYTSFADGVANLAVDLRLGNLSFWGYIEVEITGTYSNQNTAGKLTKLYAVGTNPGGSIYNNDSRVADAMGTIVDNISLGNFQWDATNTTFKIPISHIVSTGNGYAVRVRMFTYGGGAYSVFNSLSISSSYTLSALARNYVYYNDRVGIGTTAPAATLDVNGTIYSRSASGIFSDVLTAYSGGNLTLGFGSAGNLIVTGGSGGAERFKIQANGDIYTNNGAALFFGPSAATYLTGSSTSMNMAVNNAVRMTITSAGTTELRKGDGNDALKIFGSGASSYWFFKSSATIATVGSYTTGSGYLPITIEGSNLLIGTTTDNGYKLNVSGRINLSGSHPSGYGMINMVSSDSCIISLDSTTSYDVRLRYKYQGTDIWFWGMTSNNVMRLTDSGNNDRFTVTTAGAGTFSSSVTATAFFESSDKTIKTLIQDNYQTKGIESVTAKLYVKNGKEELGYYAQDLQDILPSAVSTGEDGLLNLSYREVHTAKIARLEKEVEELKSQLARL